MSAKNRLLQRCAAAVAVALAVGCASHPRDTAAINAVPLSPAVYQTQQAPKSWEEFPVPKPSNPPLTSNYRGIVTGPDKNVWFADQQNDAIDRVTMDGSVTEYHLTVTTELPLGMAAGTDGAVWFTTTGAHIGRVTTSGVVSEFAIPCGSYDGALHVGSDGNMWMPDCAGNVDRVTPTGTVTSFPVSEHQLKGMALGKDGNLWFSDITGHTIDRITPAGTVTAFAYHNLGANFATELTLGPDGNVWFSECNASEYGKITTTGTISYVQSPLCITEPNGLALGPDSAVWAATRTSTGSPALERLTASSTPTFLVLPSNATKAPLDVAKGADGNLWFTGGYDYTVGVYIRDVLGTTPLSLSFTSIGQTLSFKITEAHYNGPWNVVSANTAVAAVAAVSSPTPSPAPSTSPSPTPAPNTYAVRSAGAGNTYISVSDHLGNSVHVPVSVP